MNLKRCIALFLLTVLLCGCSVNRIPEKEASEIYFLPESYFNFAHVEPEDEAASYNELGPDFCTKAEAGDGGMRIELTPGQRDRMISRNNEFLQGYFDSLTKKSSEFSYTTDPDYKKIDLYFDETVDSSFQLNLYSACVIAYAANQILQTNDPEWNVVLTVYNCHTKKTVITFDAPYGDVSLEDDDWERSYKN